MRNSTIPESCINEEICYARTTQADVTSKLSCMHYCKQDQNASHRQNNDVKDHDKNRYSVIKTSKKSVIRDDISESKESLRTARNTIDDKMLNTSTSIQIQPANLVLSPETTIALENAEQIANNAKIKLMEISAISNFNSAEYCGNTYLNDLPLDDETEEQLYIRELIAAKLGNINTKSKSEVNGKTHAHSNAFHFPNGNMQVPTRRIDLSSSKFRMSQRRAVDRSSSEYESKVSRLSGRASLFGARSSSNNEVATTTTCENRRKTRDDRQTSTTNECETVRVNDDERIGRINGCDIQIGPSVHIERELTKQHFENVHISPNPSYTHNCANTAIYTCTSSDNGLHRTNDQNVRSVTLCREKRGRSSAIEIVTDVTLNNTEKNVVPVVTAVIRDSYHPGENDNDGQNLSSRNTKDVMEICKDDTKDENKVMETSKFLLEHMVTNERDNDIAKSTNLRKTDNGRLKVNFCDNAENHYTDNNENAAFNQTIMGTDDAQNDGNIIDRDRSKESASTAGISRKAAQNERIVSHYKTVESLDIQPLCTVSEYFSNAEHPDDSRTKDNWHEINLYKPSLNDVDLILHSNDKKIQRLVRVTQSFAELLLKPEFSKYKLHNDKQMSLHYCKEAPIKSPRSSTIVMNDENLTVRNVYQANVNPLVGTSTETTTNSSNFTAKSAENDYRSNYSKNSIESTLYPTSDASIRPSNVSSNSNEDQQLRFQTVHLDSKTAIEKSNIAELSTTKTCRGSGDRRYRHQERNINDKLDHSDTDQIVVNEINDVQTMMFPDDVSSQEPPRYLTTDMSAGRFILHALQDDKRREIVRKGSVIFPSTRKPFSNLHKSKSNTQQLETKKISRNIHKINVERREIEENIDNKDTNGDTKISESTLIACTVFKDTNVCTTVIEEEKQIEENINSRKFGQIAKQSYDIKYNDEYSSNFSECHETLGSVLKSKNDIKGKSDSCSNNGESLKQISDLRSDEDENSGVISSEANAISARSNDESNARQLSNEIDNERQKYKLHNERNNGDHSVLENRHADKNIVEIAIINQMTDAQLDMTRDTPIVPKEKEITIEKMHNNNNVKSTESMEKISEMKDKNLQSIANSDKSKLFDEVVTKEDLSHLLDMKENIKSTHTIEENVNSQCIDNIDKEMINHMKSCSSVSHCTSLHTLLSSTKDTESSMKNIASCDKKTSLNDMMDGNAHLRIANYWEIQSDSVRIMEVERDRKDENKITEIMRKDKEQYLTNSGDILPKFISGSNSSISSISMDRDSRFNNGVSGANGKLIENSSGASHSEGEIYMPSSCSYSLGEVRVLKKSGLIRDDTIDRDGSIILATRSMLTSLNNSTTSLLESSGHI